jgi:hypothetical protein
VAQAEVTAGGMRHRKDDIRFPFCPPQVHKVGVSWARKPRVSPVHSSPPLMRGRTSCQLLPVAPARADPRARGVKKSWGVTPARPRGMTGDDYRAHGRKTSIDPPPHRVEGGKGTFTRSHVGALVMDDHHNREFGHVPIPRMGGRRNQRDSTAATGALDYDFAAAPRTVWSPTDGIGRTVRHLRPVDTARPNGGPKSAWLPCRSGSVFRASRWRGARVRVN